jgi:DNA invertase Pin-like site-specific DNA recombinase
MTRIGYALRGSRRRSKRRLDRETVRAMFVAGQGPAAIAKALRCSRMQVYRVLGEGTSSGA